MSPERNLENALLKLTALAQDGEGRRVILGPRGGDHSAKALRREVLKHLHRHPGEEGVFLGKFGEEAWVFNMKLLLDALQAAMAAEGGSKLNQELPL